MGCRNNMLLLIVLLGFAACSDTRQNMMVLQGEFLFIRIEIYLFVCIPGNRLLAELSL